VPTVNQPNDAMLALSADCRVLAANDEATKLLGYQQRHALIGLDAQELFDLRQLLVRGRHGHTGYSVQQLRHKQSGEVYFGVMIMPQRQRTSGHSPARVLPKQTGEKIALLSDRAPDSGLSLARLCSEDPTLKNQALRAQRVVNSNLSILVQGETGTGKEAFARALHMASARHDKPFVALNCAAIPESLIESELFGYRHGAFTGARREGMKGKLLQSSGGTLFLDEIGDMPLQLQTRLLRVLEERLVQPLGSAEEIEVDLKVVSASHRNLREAIDNGEFREDLYYRLAAFTVQLPPFRERNDRVNVIEGILASESAEIGIPLTISDAAMQVLMRCPWPGNVRQLCNTLRAAAALCDDGMIEIRDLPAALIDESLPSGANSLSKPDPGQPASEGFDGSSFNALEQAERETLLQELELNHWNITNTAERLGMSRNTIYRKLKKFGIPTTRGAGHANGAG
jgi:transcriptional regulator of acetoin/glycerol metabolism